MILVLFSYLDTHEPITSRMEIVLTGLSSIVWRVRLVERRHGEEEAGPLLRFMDEIIMRCVCFPPWPSELLVWRTKKEMFPSNGDENSTHGETKRKECSKVIIRELPGLK